MHMYQLNIIECIMYVGCLFKLICQLTSLFDFGSYYISLKFLAYFKIFSLTNLYKPTSLKISRKIKLLKNISKKSNKLISYV